jgi:hypothetical protein
MSCDAAQSVNEVGSGKSEEFHSQPFQVFGLFQSVSTDRSSSETPFASNWGRIVP